MSADGLSEIDEEEEYKDLPRLVTPLPPLMSPDFDKVDTALTGRKYQLRKKLHNAAKEGDIDLLEELLDEPGADINSVYYGESLLWTAIMHGQEETAKFLIDNGINMDFKSCRVEIQESAEDNIEEVQPLDKKTSLNKIRLRLPIPRKLPHNRPTKLPETPIADVYVISCRELAYEKEMSNIVKLIDYKQGRLLRGLSPPDHTPRLLKSATMRLQSMGILINGHPSSNSQSHLIPHALSPHPKHYRYQQTPSKSNKRHTPNRQRHTPSRQRATPSRQRATPSRQHSVPSRQYYTPSPVKMTNYTDNEIFSPAGHSTSYSLYSYSTCRPNTIPLTKTSMARQQKISQSIGSLELRHTEWASPPAKSKITPGYDYDFEQRLAKSTRNLHKDINLKFSSYQNHLPQRRPIVASRRCRH